MEALAAVALAGNVLQFMEIAKKLYDTGSELQRNTSGSTTRNESIQENMKFLTSSLAELRSSADQFRNSQSNTRTCDLASQCIILAADIKKEIEELRLPKSARRFSLRVVRGAIRNHKAKPQIDQKLQQLSDARSELDSQILIDIRKFQSDASVATSEVFQQYQRLKLSQGESFQKLQDIINASAESVAETLKTELHSSVKEISTTLRHWKKSSEHISMLVAVLQSLQFAAMRTRLANIERPHDDTLDWIFKSQEHFVKWLREEEGIFWITGTPGSGKSTLVKFLQHSETTTEHLRHWAGDAQLVTAGFYFWAIGTSNQKSLVSLLRCMLFEIVRQSPDLLERILPSNISSLDPGLVIRHPWTTPDLLGCLHRLDTPDIKTRFCLFIDGLDEYEDSVEPGLEEATHKGDHATDSAYRIKTIVEQLSSIQTFKLCVSSRPWNVFTNAFGHRSRHLKMHELNLNDIRRYVELELCQDSYRKFLADDKVIEHIKSQIAYKSEGVFLWVVLVTKSICRSLINGDALATIQARLDTMPTKLHAYFMRMIETTEDFYQQDLIRILRIITYWEEIRDELCLPLWVFKPIYGPRPDLTLGVKAPIILLTEIQEVALIRSESAKLQARCPDLLQVFGDWDYEHNNPSVDLIHRSASEFLRSPVTKVALEEKLGRSCEEIDFDAVIMNGCFLSLKMTSTHFCASGPSNQFGYIVDRKDFHINMDVNIAYMILGIVARMADRQVQGSLLDQLCSVLMHRESVYSVAYPYLCFSYTNEDNWRLNKDWARFRNLEEMYGSLHGHWDQLLPGDGNYSEPETPMNAGSEFFTNDGKGIPYCWSSFIKGSRFRFRFDDLAWYVEEKCAKISKQDLIRLCDEFFNTWHMPSKYYRGCSARRMRMGSSSPNNPSVPISRSVLWFLDRGVPANCLLTPWIRQQCTSSGKFLPTFWEAYLGEIATYYQDEDDDRRSYPATREFLLRGAHRGVIYHGAQDMGVFPRWLVDAQVIDVIKRIYSPAEAQSLIDLVKQLDAEELQARQVSENTDATGIEQIDDKGGIDDKGTIDDKASTDKDQNTNTDNEPRTNTQAHTNNDANHSWITRTQSSPQAHLPERQP